MQAYETKLYSLFVQKLEEERLKNRERAIGTYQDLNYYHAAVSRETTLVNVLEWLKDIKEGLDKS